MFVYNKKWQKKSRKQCVKDKIKNKSRKEQIGVQKVMVEE